MPSLLDSAPACIVLLGMGGLGCPAALALAEWAEKAKTRLRLRLVDPDRVERSNLPRQILFGEAAVGQLKVDAAARRLAERSAWVELEPCPVRFDDSTAEELLAGAHLVLDGTDDPRTRFLANRLCWAKRLPLVHGAALGWVGQLMVILPGRTACLSCLFDEPAAEGLRCSSAGVFAPLCGLVGAEMAGRARDLLDGSGSGGAGCLERWDLQGDRYRRFSVERDPDCRVCGESERAALGGSKR